MNLDGYLEYVSKYNIDNNDINIQVSPNMLEISQVIFLILAYLIPQLFIIFIKFKKGRKMLEFKNISKIIVKSNFRKYKFQNM